jgi:hypothetical protein
VSTAVDTITGVATPALKEWAVVVRALLAGEQIVDVRKGGLHEEERRFVLRSPRFWLYPTTEHQQPDLVKPAYRRWLEGGTDPKAGTPLRIEGWADVAGVATIDDTQHLAAVDSKVVWTSGYVEQRLQWKQRQPLVVLALRAHRLVQPLEIEVRDEYVGCSSWVDVVDLPDDPGALDSEPALTDESFAARLDLIGRELPDGFAPA